MVTCCAYGCTNRSSKKQRTRVTFHSFPSNPELRQAWIRAIKRKDFTPTQHSRLCSEHFTDDQKYYTSLFSMRLMTNAIPTIFNFPSALKKVLAEKEEIEKTSKYEYVEYLNATSLKSLEKNNNIELKGESSCEESSSDNAEARDSVQARENLAKEVAEKTCFKTEPLTVTPIIHRSVVAVHESKRSYASFVPIISSDTSISKDIHYRPNSVKTGLLNTIMVKSKDIEMPITKSYVEELKRRLKEKDSQIESYRKKIKIIQQSSRRYKNRLEDLKHSIFTELKKRHYLSSDSSFKIGSKGCLLDRNSIKICESESEDSDGDSDFFK